MPRTSWASAESSVTERCALTWTIAARGSPRLIAARASSSRCKSADIDCSIFHLRIINRTPTMKYDHSWERIHGTAKRSTVSHISKDAFCVDSVHSYFDELGAKAVTLPATISESASTM